MTDPEGVPGVPPSDIFVLNLLYIIIPEICVLIMWHLAVHSIVDVWLPIGWCGIDGFYK